MLTILALGIVVGAVMGLTGAGGGILAVPALMLVLDWNVAQAMPVALLAVSISASVGAWAGLRQGLVRYRAALMMAVVGIPFSSLGVQLGQWFSPHTVSLMFAILMLWVGMRQLYGQHHHLAIRHDEAICHVNNQTGRLVWSWLTALMIGSIGAITGLFTGLLGVGGGFIMVPLLHRVTDISIQGVIATVLLVMALVASGGIAVALYHGVEIPLYVAVPFTISSTVGLLLGRRLAHQLDPRLLHIGFGLMVLLVGLAVGAKTLLNK